MRVDRTLEVKVNKLKGLSDLWLKAASSAAYQEAEEVIADAKENYVPVVTGNLRNSSFVDDPERRGDKVTVTLGFGKEGSPAEAYALAVHEMPPDWGQGKNKFLEKPLMKRAKSYDRRIAERFNEYIKKKL